MSKIKRFNVEIPDDLHTKVKAKCAEEGITITEFLHKAAESFIAKPVKRAHMAINPLMTEIQKTATELRDQNA